MKSCTMFDCEDDTSEVLRYSSGVLLVEYGRRCIRIGGARDSEDIVDDKWKCIVGRRLYGIRKWRVHLWRHDARAADAIGVQVNVEGHDDPTVVIWSGPGQPLFKFFLDFKFMFFKNFPFFSKFSIFF